MKILTNLSEKTQNTLSKRGFNCLVCTSALAFNHIPALGLANAFNLIAPNGWIAFNVQKERWEDKSETSFVASHPWVAETDIFEIADQHIYQHRFHMDGRPLYYIAIIGTKGANIPKS